MTLTKQQIYNDVMYDSKVQKTKLNDATDLFTPNHQKYEITIKYKGRQISFLWQEAKGIKTGLFDYLSCLCGDSLIVEDCDSNKDDIIEYLIESLGYNYKGAKKTADILLANYGKLKHLLGDINLRDFTEYIEENYNKWDRL